MFPASATPRFTTLFGPTYPPEEDILGSQDPHFFKRLTRMRENKVARNIAERILLGTPRPHFIRMALFTGSFPGSSEDYSLIKNSEDRPDLGLTRKTSSP